MAPVFTGNWFGFGRSSADGAVPDPPATVSGGNITPTSGSAPGNGYNYHTFTANGTLTISGGTLHGCTILAVGGGGAGGCRNEDGSDGGGGGGGGGVVKTNGIDIQPGSYTVTVGESGQGIYTNGGATEPPQMGGDTIVSKTGWTLTAKGGGGAGNGPQRGPVAPGGCGGGGGGGGGTAGSGPFAGEASQPTQTHTGLSAPQYTNYGNDGGLTDAVGPHQGAGGGGAGTAGGQGLVNGPGAGGSGGQGTQQPLFTGPLIGIPALNPMSGYYSAGGGGGGGGPGDYAGGSGGTGGGGNGTASNAGNMSGAGADVNYNGSGGGGSAGHTGGSSRPGGTSGPGSDGVCIVMYPTSANA